MTQQGSTESQSTYKRRLYDTMHYMCRAATESKEMRIANLWPQAAWPTVWKNLGEAPVPETTKAAWYKVIHDILPTNVRLFRIRMIPTDACRKRDRTYTFSHRLIDCGEGEHMDMDKTASSLDTTDNPGADAQRLGCASSFHTVAPQDGDVQCIGQSSHIPNRAATGTDVTRLHRLHEAVKVEAVPVA